MGDIEIFPERQSRPLTPKNCLGLDPELFFPPFEEELLGVDGCLINLPDQQSRHEQEEANRIRIAKNVCAGCADKEDCLHKAITQGDKGIWGGTTEDERRAMMGRRALEESLASHPSQLGFGVNVIEGNFGH